MYVYFAVSGFINAIVSTLLGLYILLIGRKNPVHRSFSYFAFSVAVWSWAYIGWPLAGSQKNVLLFFQLLHIGASFTPITYFNFVITWLGVKDARIIWLRTIGIALSVFFGSVTFSSHFISGMIPKFSMKYWANPGILYHFYLLYFFLYVCIACIILIRKLKYSSNILKEQIKYILAGFTLSFIGGSTNYFLWYGINIPPYGNILASSFVICTFYAIVKYRLMDIGLVVTKAGIFVTVYILVLGIPFCVGLYLLGSGLWLVPMTLMAVFSMAGPYVYMYIQRKAEKRLLYEQHQYQNTLRRASMGMGRIKELGHLLRLIVHIVSKTVKLENAAIYLFHEASNQYTLRATKGRGIEDDSESVIAHETDLIKHLKKVKEPIVQEEITQKAADYRDKHLSNVSDAMQNLNAALAIPSFIEDRLIAVIFLGKKKDGKLYSHDDLVVFSILSNQAALAIENAQFVEDTKKTHEQLFKAEKMATIGTMADGLSHQINNRLHAMGFIAGDALDTVQLEKAGKLPKVQSEKILETLQYALERLVDNVKKGGEVVEGLLRYTRTGDGGFTEINLNELIKSSFEMVQYKIKITAMDVENNIDEKVFHFKGNFTQLQEVFFNLIDNAYDSIVQRREDLGEKDYQGKLVFSSEERAKTIHIKVKDNGIGVKKEDRIKLFTPFFTSKLSSKKGTGLGLYVIKQIIEENHKGRVIFNSEYREGAEITIILPKIIE